MANDLVNDTEVKQLQQLVVSQSAEKADVIVWLQGNEYDRGEKVLELFEGDFAPKIFVTGNNVNKIDTGTVMVEDIVAWLGSRGVDRASLLVDDQAMNTRDQALHIVELAKDRQWTRVILVASTHHQMRAFLTVLKQASKVGWNGKIINQPTHHEPDEMPGGRTKSSAESFEDELVKIQKYSDDVASIMEGIKYALRDIK